MGRVAFRGVGYRYVVGRVVFRGVVSMVYFLINVAFETHIYL